MTLNPKPNPAAGRVVLVLQGGGALGAYQVGVYQAMEQAGLRPDWVIGTSIGAINGALIAGNAPGDRMDKLTAFWHRVQRGLLPAAAGSLPLVGAQIANWLTTVQGLGGFFTPNHLAFASQTWPLGTTKAGYYSVEPLKQTLSDLIDFKRINDGTCRLTVGAADVRNAQMHYFDSRKCAFDIRHVLASGALPPAFPPVEIDGGLYWDGGILSNTPVEAVFDDYPRRSSLVFVVHIWSPAGSDPVSICDVMERDKDVRYASRAQSHIARQQQIHRLRHVVSSLAQYIPEADRANPEVEDLLGYGCVTKMHVVRIVAPRLPNDNQYKDIDFSEAGIAARWAAGLADTRATIARAPWTEPSDPLEGFVLHEPVSGQQTPDLGMPTGLPAWSDSH